MMKGGLQKETVDNFVNRIKNSNSKDMMMYAVMRFGKTYTAIRCLQEFYKNKNKDDVSKFSVVCTAKPEVKDEWLKGINKYKTDYIDSNGKHYNEQAEGLVERTFNDFVAYDLNNFIDKVSEKVEQVETIYKTKGTKDKPSVEKKNLCTS